MTTGERIRNRRKELGVSAEQLAERLGVSPATIYRYENGAIEKVPGDILPVISKVLSTSPAYLMGWEVDSPTPVPALDIESIIKDEPIAAYMSLRERLTDDDKADIATLIRLRAELNQSDDK